MYLTRTSTLHKLILTALFAALTAVGAFIKIPLPIAPITLQLFFTVLAGLLLGPTWGAASQLVYLLLGLCGLPIFAQGGGFAYIFVPSFGFLLGLPATAWIVGILAQKRPPQFWPLCLCCLAGLAALYLIGVPYLYMILRFYLGKQVTVWGVVYSGCLLFLPGDCLKILVTSQLAVRLIPAVGRVEK